MRQTFRELPSGRLGGQAGSPGTKCLFRCTVPPSQAYVPIPKQYTERRVFFFLVCTIGKQTSEFLRNVLYNLFKTHLKILQYSYFRSECAPYELIHPAATKCDTCTGPVQYSVKARQQLLFYIQTDDFQQFRKILMLNNFAFKWELRRYWSSNYIILHSLNNIQKALQDKNFISGLYVYGNQGASTTQH